jgi:hypothetical protein
MGLTNVASCSNLLMQMKNITYIFTREFLTIDHWKITLHAIQIEILDQSFVKPWINEVVKIKQNMIPQITLCREHIVIVGFPNYKFILMHTK